MQRTTPLVFRIQEPPARVECSRDYSSIAGYGDMVTLLDVDDNPSVHPQDCYEKLYEGLRDMIDGDYILWAGGDPASAFMAGAVIADISGISIKWLRWDRRTDPSGKRTNFGYYTPVEML